MRTLLSVMVLFAVSLPLPSQGNVPFQRGDANADGAFDIADPVTMLSFLFNMGPVACEAALDANDDNSADVADVIHALAAIFQGGPNPPPPFMACGTDPTPGGTLSCESFPLCSGPPAPVIHVQTTATGANDGTSWVNAFTDLQEALAVASAGDEIWVAAGTYTPAPPDGPPEATFTIPSAVAVYGGFAGDETSRDQRDPIANVTYLSGDLNGDDTDQFVTLPNSWHVVTMSAVDSSTRLDGFEVERGYTFFGPATEQMGAGLLISSGDPTVANCGFTLCFADRGGGIYASSGTATFENCHFNGNYGSDWLGEGGAMLVESAATVTITDSTFTGNRAEALGGWSKGGAIRSRPGAQVTIERCVFTGNQALHRTGNGIDWCRGGAIFSEGSILISHSKFDGNVSNVAGAVQSWGGPSTRVLNSTFRNNDAIGLFISGQPRDGAAGAIAGGAEIEIIGCVVYGGDSDNYGGAWVGEGALVSGSIFWNNTDSNGSIGRSNIRAQDLVEYCCVQNMLVGEPGEDPPDPQDFPGSISADPLFLNAATGNFRIQAGSPCIDAADNGAWPAGVMLDLDGNPRFVDDPATPDTGAGPPPVVDMGAYEFQIP